jgi:hypothetical protein
MTGHQLRLLVMTLTLAAGASLAGCGSRAPLPTTPTETEARTLAHRVIDTLERDDFEGWWDLLSTRAQRRTVDARREFARWQQMLVPFARALRDAEWTLGHYTSQDVLYFRAIGKQPERLVRVVAERGALRIDENAR